MKKKAVVAGAMLIMVALAANKTLADEQVVEEWVARYDRAGSADYATDMAMDSSGNIYVTGTGADGPNELCITIKYTPDSNEPNWIAQYDITGNYGDFDSYIALDDSGSVYVAGAKVGADGDCDYLTIKYDTNDGNEVWTALYDGPANGDDWAQAIAVDNAGNIYVMGVSDGNETDIDYATVKYTPDSNIPVWVARYDGPTNGYDEATAIAVDNSGNIYVTGVSDGNETNDDYATLKYTSDSNIPVWIARYDGPANSWDWPTAIAVDYSGDVYVTGESNGNYATVKYNRDSNEPVWIARYDGPANGYDEAVAIAIDNSKNIYVTGSSEGIGTEDDYLTIKYHSNSSEPVWVARYDGPANGEDWPEAITVDNFGNIYVTGVSVGNGAGRDYATIRYSPDGNDVWIARYDGPGNDEDWAHSISVNNLGNVYVTGFSYGSGTSYDYATIKYSQAGYIKAGVSMVFNGSFENPGWKDNGQDSDIDVSKRPPERWCDVNLPDGFSAKIIETSLDWSTKGDHSLTIYSKAFQQVEAGDVATVSQQVYLEDVNTISFDVRLFSSSGFSWNSAMFSAVLLIDGNEVWDSDSNGTGVYLGQRVSVDEYYKDEFLHALSLGIKAYQSGRTYAHESQWDFVKFNTHCYGGYGIFSADFDCDCDIDALDLDMLAERWLQQEPNEIYDLFQDGDNIINFRDFSVFADDWTMREILRDDDGLLAADLNDDGIVNYLDFARLGLDWASEGRCLKGDIDGPNNDGKEVVDYEDVYKLIEQWLNKSWLYGLQ